MSSKRLLPLRVDARGRLRRHDRLVGRAASRTGASPQAAHILHEPPSWVVELIGTINGPRAVTVERAYLNAWFDTYLRRRSSPLLIGPSPRYPEVVFADPSPAT